MTIQFETARLFVRPLEKGDSLAFFELMSNPHVMDPIPQKVFNKEESEAKLLELMSLEKTSDTRIWALCEKGKQELIGICGVLKNDVREDEIAYRLLETHWGKGYGTEIAKGLIDYCFNVLKSNYVTADVCVDNAKSLKILNSLFTFQKEFFNAKDNCKDRRYGLKKEVWLKQLKSD